MIVSCYIIKFSHKPCIANTFGLHNLNPDESLIEILSCFMFLHLQRALPPFHLNSEIFVHTLDSLVATTSMAALKLLTCTTKVLESTIQLDRSDTMATRGSAAVPQWSY